MFCFTTQIGILLLADTLYSCPAYPHLSFTAAESKSDMPIEMQHHHLVITIVAWECGFHLLRCLEKHDGHC